MELDVLAGFTHQFARGAEFPPAPDSPFRFGVINDPRFAEVMRTMLSGRDINGRTIEIREGRTESDASLAECDVVFIPRHEAHRTDQVLEEFRGRSTLVIAESDDPNANKAMITLFRSGKHIRFNVNPVESKRAGILLPSNILKYASKRKEPRSVDTEEERG